MDFPILNPLYSSNDEILDNVKLISKSIKKVEYFSKLEHIYIAIPSWTSELFKNFLYQTFKKHLNGINLLFVNKNLLLTGIFFNLRTSIFLECGMFTSGISLIEKKDELVYESIDMDDYEAKAELLKRLSQQSQRNISKSSLNFSAKDDRLHQGKKNTVNEIIPELNDIVNKPLNFNLQAIYKEYHLEKNIDYKPSLLNSATNLTSLLYAAFREANLASELINKPTALVELLDENTNDTFYKELFSSSITTYSPEGLFSTKLNTFNELFKQRDKLAGALVKDEVKKFLPLIRKLYREISLKNSNKMLKSSNRMTIILHGKFFDFNNSFAKILAKEIRLQFGAVDIFYLDDSSKVEYIIG